jgi:hypothetical protein
MFDRIACGFALGLAVACGGSGGAEDCTVGSASCACTPGGGCDPGLTCALNTCVSMPGMTGAGDATDPDSGPVSATSPSTSTSADSGSTATIDDGIKLDVGSSDETGLGPCAKTGCKRVDMLFALDSSLSMSEEINALAMGAAFADIVFALENLNCGAIEYRIGLTNDNDGGFLSNGPNPWFDSNEMTPAEITMAFSQAAVGVLGNGGTPLGCEHVLSSAADLLVTDDTGFLRDDALLVMVLVTDVDDYGEYDQLGWPQCMCPFGVCDQLCATSGRDVVEIYADLLALKGGDENGLATIVVAGDPGVTAGANLCGQPASCCGQDIECGQAHHAPRLWEFAMGHAGTNGVTADICDGAQMVPAAIEGALTGQIDLACQTFTPAG